MTTQYTSDQVHDAHFARSLQEEAHANSCSPEDIIREDYTEYDADNTSTLGAAYHEANEKYKHGQALLAEARLTYSERHTPTADGDNTAEVWSGYLATSPTTRTTRLTRR